MYKVNISIDDVTPHPKSGMGVVQRCLPLLEEFPDIKISLFVPLNYTRKGEPSYNILSYPLFCRALRILNPNNFEIGFHGYNHGLLGISNNDEFETILYEEALNKFVQISDIAHQSKVPFKPIFRPPAWRMSATAISAAIDTGMHVITLSPDKYAKDTYGGYDEKDHIAPYIMYYTSAPPFKPLQLVEKTSIVYHACEWDKNYFDDAKLQSLIAFLKENEGNYRFSFLEELKNG